MHCSFGMVSMDRRDIAWASLAIEKEIERKKKMGKQNKKIMSGTLKEARNQVKRLKRRYRRSREEKAEYPNEEEVNASVMGFGVNKIFDRDSIFCGLPSVNTLVSYVEILVDNWNLLPDAKDSKLQSRAKILAIIWRVLRHIKINGPTVMDRTDLTEIDFGVSRDVIGRLVDEIMEPDEVFRPRHRSALTPPFSMYRYPFAHGYMYWVTENSDETKSIV